MELSPAIIALILIAIIAGAPLLIWIGMRSAHQQIDILRKTGSKIKNPFQQEDNQLARLHRDVESLKQPPKDPPTDPLP